MFVDGVWCYGFDYVEECYSNGIFMISDCILDMGFVIVYVYLWYMIVYVIWLVMLCEFGMIVLMLMMLWLFVIGFDLKVFVLLFCCFCCVFESEWMSCVIVVIVLFGIGFVLFDLYCVLCCNCMFELYECEVGDLLLYEWLVVSYL